jgi:cephalosporin hydroxylase
MPRDPAAPANPAAHAYLRWYYDSAVWKRLAWRGVRTLKLPADMWNYQEIIEERGCGWVVETGTRHGGSALFFADLLEARGAEGKVITVDVDESELDARARAHPRIVRLLGDSAGAETVSRIVALLAARTTPVFMILDSDHSAAHVRRELDALVPILRRGDTLVVEDTIINGHPVRPGFDPGPMEAVASFLAARPDALVPDAARESKFGCSFAASGFFLVP